MFLWLWECPLSRSSFNGPGKAPVGGGRCLLSRLDVQFPSLDATGKERLCPFLSPFEIWATSHCLRRSYWLSRTVSLEKPPPTTKLCPHFVICLCTEIYGGGFLCRGVSKQGNRRLHGNNNIHTLIVRLSFAPLFQGTFGSRFEGGSSWVFPIIT